MNWGLFAMLVGFILPLGLAVRAGFELAWARGRGWRHPLVMALGGYLLLASIPMVALIPAVLTVCGRPSAAGALLLTYAATGWGAVKLAVTLLAALVVDLTMPRVCAQLAAEPVTETWVSGRYLARDTGILLICLMLAWAAAR